MRSSTTSWALLRSPASSFARSLAAWSCGWSWRVAALEPKPAATGRGSPARRLPLAGCGMPVPKDVNDYLVESHPSLADLALWVREAVLAGEPDLADRAHRGWDGIGFGHPTPATCAPSTPRAGHEVHLLFEHGARLDDEERLLEGDGRQTPASCGRASGTPARYPDRQVRAGGRGGAAVATVGAPLRSGAHIQRSSPLSGRAGAPAPRRAATARSGSPARRARAARAPARRRRCGPRPARRPPGTPRQGPPGRACPPG